MTGVSCCWTHACAHQQYNKTPFISYKIAAVLVSLLKFLICYNKKCSSCCRNSLADGDRVALQERAEDRHPAESNNRFATNRYSATPLQKFGV